MQGWGVAAKRISLFDGKKHVSDKLHNVVKIF
jgi:hypothetical protein